MRYTGADQSDVMAGVYTPSASSDAGPSLDYCTLKWTEAMSLCEDNLSEGDREYLGRIKSYDDFIQNVKLVENSMAPRISTTLFQRIAPILDPILGFVTLLAACFGSSPVETALMWGLMSLLLRAASRTETLLPETIEMLKELAHDLEIFQVHGETFARNPRIGDELMDIFVDIIIFWTQTIHFLNRNKHGTTAQRAWPNIQKKFEDTLKRIRKRSEQIKEKANAIAQVQGPSQADLLKELDRLGLLSTGSSAQRFSTTEESNLPCCNIPFSRNQHFFGREAELSKIRKSLDDPSAAGSFRSFALFGTGGIGKTQIAITYAYEQKDAGTEAVLWFNCETGLSLARSFADAASLLKLEGASEDETSEQNKFLVLRWLRRTVRVDRTWLCVFDNVEDLEIFRNAWPVADSGRVLVTSRNDIVSIDPAAGGMEVEVFDEHKGRDMILQHVGRLGYDDAEVEAARQLANRLGGLALALVVMSSQVRLRRLSIASFVKLYENHSTRLNKESRGIESYYKLSLATCWQTTFDYLSPNASHLWGVIAHLGPDALPEDLFHPEHPSRLPVDMEFCADDWLLSEALEELLSTSVIRKDPVKNVFFIHRLTQEEFRSYMGYDRQHQSFVAASILLCEAFPKLTLGQSMRLNWEQCKRYIQHVLFLCARWTESKFKPKRKEEFEPFLLLATACGWYLMESGAWQAEIDLMETAMSNCEEKEGILYAILANSRGEMECERGHCDEAYKYIRPSLEIVRRVFGDDHPEVGSGFNNYGNIIFQDQKENACERAIEYYNKALAIFEANGPEVYTKLFHIPHTNLTRVYRVLKQYDKAIYHAEQCRKWAVDFLGEGNHFDALADYHVGNALFELGRFDEAEKYWLRALELFKRENETHPTTNAARIKLSTIEMKRGHFDEAISILQEVLIVTKLNQPSKGDNGEVARAQRKLAEAYELKGVLHEATRLRTEAEAMRKEIQGPRFEELPDCDLSYAMMSFHACW